jgi:DNA-binding PadR family transcriptional regulator
MTEGGERRRGADPGLLVLISLASGPKHGYAMTTDIAAFAGRRLGPGTLYGAIQRLEQGGLIEPMASGDRRIPYRLTPPGERYLAERIDGFERLTEVAHRRIQSWPRDAD